MVNFIDKPLSTEISSYQTYTLNEVSSESEIIYLPMTFQQLSPSTPLHRNNDLFRVCGVVYMNYIELYHAIVHEFFNFFAPDFLAVVKPPPHDEESTAL